MERAHLKALNMQSHSLWGMSLSKSHFLAIRWKINAADALSGCI
jgi:hypothetical protein